MEKNDGNRIAVQHIPNLKLKQLQYEAGTWKRLLLFMSDENICLKNRLSEILKGPFNGSLLDELENFQSRFIREDELLLFMRSDFVALDKLLQLDDYDLEEAIQTRS